MKIKMKNNVHPIFCELFTISHVLQSFYHDCYYYYFIKYNILIVLYICMFDKSKYKC